LGPSRGRGNREGVGVVEGRHGKKRNQPVQTSKQKKIRGGGTGGDNMGNRKRRLVVTQGEEGTGTRWWGDI